MPSVTRPPERLTEADKRQILASGGTLPEGVEPPKPLARKLPKGELMLLLDDAFYAEMDRKPRVGVLSEYRWVLDEVVRLRSLVGRYMYRQEETLPQIRELLLSAPGKTGLNEILELLYDPKVAEKLRSAVVKADDDGGEEAHRGRTGQKRFGVIAALADVGQPLPPWLDQFGELSDG